MVCFFLKSNILFLNLSYLVKYLEKKITPANASGKKRSGNFPFPARHKTAKSRQLTVTLQTEEEISHVKNTVPELKEAGSFLAITIPDHDHSNQHFIIPSPEPSPDIPIGRWTRASFTFDVDGKR